MTRNDFKQWIIYHVEIMNDPCPVAHLVIGKEDVEWIARWMLDLGIDHNVYAPTALKNARIFTFIKEDFLEKADSTV